MQASSAVSWSLIVIGVVFAIAAVSGMMWPATPPSDSGLVATVAILVLFGVAGLQISRSAV